MSQNVVISLQNEKKMKLNKNKDKLTLLVHKQWFQINLQSTKVTSLTFLFGNCVIFCLR